MNTKKRICTVIIVLVIVCAVCVGGFFVWKKTGKGGSKSSQKVYVQKVSSLNTASDFKLSNRSFLGVVEAQEKIPMSVERQRAILEQQIDEIMMGIREAKEANAERFTIKQMEKTKKGLQAKIDKLNDQSRKDDVVTFEELGVDRIFIDESHYFKNRAKRCA